MFVLQSLVFDDGDDVCLTILVKISMMIGRIVPCPWGVHWRLLLPLRKLSQILPCNLKKRQLETQLLCGSCGMRPGKRGIADFVLVLAIFGMQRGCWGLFLRLSDRKSNDSIWMNETVEDLEAFRVIVVRNPSRDPKLPLASIRHDCCSNCCNGHNIDFFHPYSDTWESIKESRNLKMDNHWRIYE